MPRSPSKIPTEDHEQPSMRRWEHLAEVAFRLTESLDSVDFKRGDEDSETRRARLESSLGALDDLLEVFGRELDPVEDLPEFALRRLLVALRRSLAGLLSPRGPC